MIEMIYRKTLMLAAALGFASGGWGAPATGLYEETKSTVTKWAETESLISEEASKWEKDKAILEDLERMLKAEKAALSEKIEQSRASATESDKRRLEISERKEALEEASNVVRSSLEVLEEGIRELVPYFPESYAESIAPLLRQLPTKGKPTQLPLSIRLRNVIGILSQANKFDNVVNLQVEARKFDDDTSKQVTTLYFGFAIAYYSDATGEHAGYGYPTAEGWKWEETPERGLAILDAISMYQKGKQAAFVNLPVVIN